VLGLIAAIAKDQNVIKLTIPDAFSGCIYPNFLENLHSYILKKEIVP
jgi:hypothetical protein